MAKQHSRVKSRPGLEELAGETRSSVEAHHSEYRRHHDETWPVHADELGWIYCAAAATKLVYCPTYSAGGATCTEASKQE